MTTRIQPRGPWVHIKPDEVEQITDSGLYIPDSVEQEKKSYGTVLAIGEHVSELGVGDKAVYGAFAGEHIEVKGEKSLLIHSEDIIATLHEETISD